MMPRVTHIDRLALLLALLSLVMTTSSVASTSSLPGTLPILAASLAQLAWHEHRPRLARLMLMPILLILGLCLASHLIPEYWLAHASLDRLADYLSPGSLLVDWRPPLLITLCLGTLCLSLLVRTRASLGAPLLLGMTGMLLVVQLIGWNTRPTLLPLAGAPLEQAVLWLLLVAQLARVSVGWRVTRPSIQRALWPSLALTLLTILFWHQQMTLSERELRTQTQQQGQRMAEQLSREIDEHLAAMRRFTHIWRLTDTPPNAAQWQRQAAPYQQDFRYFLNIAYIDADSRILHAHPLNAVNRGIIGSRLYDDQPAGRPAVRAALEEGREGRTDIITLLQGVPGIIHYLPIFHADTEQPAAAVAMVVSLPVLADTLFTRTSPDELALTLRAGQELIAHQPATSRLGPWQYETSLALESETLALITQPTLAQLLGQLPRLPVVSLAIGLVLATLLYLALFAHHQMITQHHSVTRSNRELRTEVRERTRLQQEIEWLAGHDELTSLPNRRTFMKALERHADQRPLSLLLCDIDHFKRLNDQLGHLEGDRHLTDIAKCGRKVVERAGGLFARFGGEEFVACLPCHDHQQASRVAESLRQAVEGLGLTHADGTPLTISAGVATQVTGPLQTDALLRAADEALYAAKSAGRNQVVLAGMSI
ncbi:sensor domain-containing diguanylate cyclase [Halomonas urumqiensis]|uniref:diguanylate cyclase n=1 Tax=Halomonas urumqiensis TaxID=1684789 RepID=A0A2N7UP32_9GAMM|nr:sensor domain-containing diguanylate cyclase [Halomonas urumqiensis]PMR82181.1 hypothetical protein C1H70_03020 [Halomonas urumqiensis]PTB03043.1 sensor domain-containing diguanylate cyclase [Halomonas urumqiensis]GHE20827.1 hypothetical protein GCM10017767_13480 [Halomonas urumqiensis]